MAHAWLFGTVLFGLAASLSWGTGDFSGGLASRRAHVFSVVVATYAVGTVILPVLWPWHGLNRSHRGVTRCGARVPDWPERWD